MQIDTSFSRRSVWVILLFMLVLFGVSAGTFYATFKPLSAAAASSAGGEAAAGGPLPALVQQKASAFKTTLLPVLGAAHLAVGLLLWLVLRAMTGGATAAQRPPAHARTERAAAADEEAGGAATSGDRNLQQRLFVHLLSVLQREGRLVDFFSENLDGYEDAQIGAAVRSIHEKCRAGLEKYLKLEPVVSNPEGQTITLKPGFDAVAIKVVGNVAGDPPFTGVVRHRGWRAVAIEIPTLTNIRDAGLIAPAEIEVQ